jgi:hypothetical protein
MAATVSNRNSTLPVAICSVLSGAMSVVGFAEHRVAVGVVLLTYSAFVGGLAVLFAVFLVPLVAEDERLKRES